MITAKFSGKEVNRIIGEKPAFLLISSTFVAAYSRANNNIHPPMPAKKIDLHRPFAAVMAAPLVSSETWAEASKPVIVYWVNKKPSGNT